MSFECGVSGGINFYFIIDKAQFFESKNGRSESNRHGQLGRRRQKNPKPFLTKHLRATPAAAHSKI